MTLFELLVPLRFRWDANTRTSSQYRYQSTNLNCFKGLKTYESGSKVPTRLPKMK